MSIENRSCSCNPLEGAFSRREALRTFSGGFGLLALGALGGFGELGSTRTPQDTAANPLAPHAPHFAARAKRIIWLNMAGAPSHVDTFDYKPKLNAADGQATSAARRGGGKWLGSPWKFGQHGQSGQWISELFPKVAEHADKLCILNGMSTDVPAHQQAALKLHTGNFQFVRPSVGSWTLYGLGTENRNLPGFVAFSPPAGQGGGGIHGSAFLPAIFQGQRVGVSRGGGLFRSNSQDDAVPNIENEHYSQTGQREQLDFVQELNKERLRVTGAEVGTEGVIEAAELAFRMQAEVPTLLDLSSESKKTQDAYGLNNNDTSGFGKQCLLARRFAEKGVRFIQLSQGGWDHHRNLRNDLARSAISVDQPIAALLADLAQRGLLKDTLVLWGGEFGRTPYAQGDDGRDHNHKGFTLWMAGGGVKGGLRYGATDEYGMEAVDGRLSIHDLHATMLHLMGLDHTKLTHRYAGRDFRLTDVHGEVAREILA
ncbi:MAG: DUF1501 domain-containing protein [Planctomycetes bacterium]|nr:DUF1501 domain-containing protein [Planctomycetota bacterium]